MLAYWRQDNPPYNYGDYASELLLDLFFPDGRENILSDNTTTYHLIGSTIADAWIDKSLNMGRRPDFWACGCRGIPVLFERSLYTVRGVRGFESRRLLNGSAPTIGDSALLIPLLLPKKKQILSKEPIFVPHFWDPIDNSEIAGLRTVSVKLQNNDQLRSMIEEIAGASFVLAGSMHAAVTALAYDVPFAFYQNGPQGFLDCPPKWVDFASAHGFAAQFVHTLEEGQAWHQSIAASLRFPSLLRLLEHAPYPVLPEIKSRPAELDQARAGKVWQDETRT